MMGLSAHAKFVDDIILRTEVDMLEGDEPPHRETLTDWKNEPTRLLFNMMLK